MHYREPLGRHTTALLTPTHTGRDGARAWIWAERLAWAGGIAALAFWVVVSTSGFVGGRRELRRFAEARSSVLAVSASPDQSLWSPRRVSAFAETRTKGAPAALAVMRIPRIGIEVAVLAGTDEWTLNRAVGHIDDTGQLGGEGNAGIAGHRDSYFRGLKDIRTGDHIDLETRGGIDRYRVEQTWIVTPDDLWVLDPTEKPALTLVTCYPFYFVGSAPQRFVVRAVRTSAAQ